MAGKVIYLHQWKGKGENRIDKVGLELEGAWGKLPPGVTKLEPDMSVNFLCGDRNKPLFTPDEQAKFQIGELPSPPLDLICVPGWLKDSYPVPGGKIHQYCGLHVHMSFFNPRHYCQLSDSPDFQETMLAELTEWATREGFPKKHHIWGRLNGSWEYCTKNFWPELQMTSDRDHDRQREGNRYTAVNYCWKAHRTIEVRALPMMETAAQAIRAVEEVIETTNAYLVATAKKEEKLVLQIPPTNKLGPIKQVRRVAL